MTARRRRVGSPGDERIHPPELGVSAAPTHSWTYVDDAGEEMGNSETFDDRQTAEDWMGQAWQDLLERGVEEVVLVDHERDRTVYRMGLREE
jgi:hypothetical protein